MQLDVEPTSVDRAVIRLSGRLNMVAAPRFRELVTRIVDQEGRRRIVVDLAGTDFMESTGLGALIAGLKTTRMAGGDVRIARAGTQVMMVLQLTSPDQILHPHNTVEECFELAQSGYASTGVAGSSCTIHVLSDGKASDGGGRADGSPETQGFKGPAESQQASENPEDQRRYRKEDGNMGPID